MGLYLVSLFLFAMSKPLPVYLLWARNRTHSCSPSPNDNSIGSQAAEPPAADSAALHCRSVVGFCRCVDQFLCNKMRSFVVRISP